MKILIADDHAANRDILRFTLEEYSHDCVMAGNGREAVEIFCADTAIGMILMDINMPGLDGIAATQEICRLKKDRFVTIIFITAFDDPEILAQCLDAGGDDFIP